MFNYERTHLRQLTIPEFLAYLDQTPTKDLDRPVQSNQTKLEILLSNYLDTLSTSSSPLTIEQVSILKILFELTR